MNKSYVNRPLQGYRIMITRPAQLADKLAYLCSEQGAMVIRLPCMEIVDTSHSEANFHKIKQLDKYSLLIFISRNAVYYGTRILREVGVSRIDTPVAAVGITTAQALADAGIPNAIHPCDAMSSRALADTQFIKSMKQGAVLIFRGQGGNPYLGDQLSRRGWKVDYAEVYRRQRPREILRWDERYLFPDLITAASGETLANLHAMTDQHSISSLLNGQLVLGSHSMKELHKHLGFKRPPLIARSPVDEDMFQTIMQVYSKNRLI